MDATVDPREDVFSAAEVALAAGTSVARVDALLQRRGTSVASGRFLTARDAVTAIRALRREAISATGKRPLFEPPAGADPAPALPIAASGGLHACALALAIFATLGVAAETPAPAVRTETPRLVFVALPGPGGGGGGGGLRQPEPPRPAQTKGKSALRSPVVVHRTERRPKTVEPRRATPPPVPTPTERVVEPPPAPAKPDPTPPVVAPVASVAADKQDQQGVLTDPAPAPPSQGPGTGGGAGRGAGSGIGEGTGSGIGPGTGGGTGGGPYREGSGVTPPRILHEVKPDYTDEARRRGLVGEVVLEIVVQRDGRVGAIRVVQGIGGGLDQRAVEAVRQWRFAPGERQGTPVDVLVEVAVEFRLR